MSPARNPETDKRRRGNRETWDRINRGEGFIYVAKVARRPLVKIGFSMQPERRVLQAAYPFYRKLKLLRTVPGTIREERAIHRALRGRSAGRHSEVYPLSILSHAAIPEALRAA